MDIPQFKFSKSKFMFERCNVVLTPIYINTGVSLHLHRNHAL